MPQLIENSITSAPVPARAQWRELFSALKHYQALVSKSRQSSPRAPLKPFMSERGYTVKYLPSCSWFRRRSGKFRTCSSKKKVTGWEGSLSNYFFCRNFPLEDPHSFISLSHLKFLCHCARGQSKMSLWKSEVWHILGRISFLATVWTKWAQRWRNQSILVEEIIPWYVVCFLFIHKSAVSKTCFHAWFCFSYSECELWKGQKRAEIKE